MRFKNIFWSLVMGLLWGTLATASAAEKQAAEAARRQPNVILVLADDLGSADLGCYGAHDIKTPNLDRLAQDGVRFTQFYVTSSVCSPSRASLLTGCWPGRVALEGNVGAVPPGPGLPGRCQTMAETLRDAGYQTALVGKWHLGSRPGERPNDQGFGLFFGFRNGCIDNFSHTFYWEGPHAHDLWQDEQEVWCDGEHLAEVMLEQSARFIRENRQRPFFLYYASNLPHYPKQSVARFREMYQAMAEPRRSYAACLSYLDEQVGRLRREVEQAGLARDTIFIFLGDNGHSVEERNGYGGGDAGPYRGAKNCFFEGGVRMPCLVSWPGTLPEGQTRAQLSASLDLLPTLAELCRARAPEGIDGRSLAPVLRSASAPAVRDTLYWQLNNEWAVRQGEWKLLGHPLDVNPTQKRGVAPTGDRLFLANLARDPGEKTNLAAEHPQVVERLAKLHAAWRTQVAQAQAALKQP